MAATAASVLAVSTSANAATDISLFINNSVGSLASASLSPQYPLTSVPSTATLTVSGAKSSTGAIFSGPAALTECANADSLGNSLSAADIAAPGGAALYCFGAANVGSPQLPFINFDATGAASASYPVVASGIGTANAQCLPNKAIPCTLAYGDVAGAGTLFAVAIPVFGGPIINTALIAPPVGRAGAAISFTGVDFTASATSGTASLCDSNGTTGCTALTGVSISVDSLGALTGSGSIPAAATAGAHKLVVTTGAAATLRGAGSNFAVLGVPSITLSPATGGPGQAIVVSGSNFDPGKTLFLVDIALAAPTTVLGGPVVVTSDANGNFTSPATTGALQAVTGMDAVAAGLASPDGLNQAVATFNLTATSCVAANIPTVTGTCAVVQTVQQQVTGTSLNTTEAGPTVAMGEIKLNGIAQTGHGNLKQVTVIDARGTLTGWTVTGSITDLTSNPGAPLPQKVGNHTLPKTGISWTPACAAVDGIAGEITAGAAGTLVDGALLCSAAPGGGGGTFTGDAPIDIQVASSKAAGLYVGTLTLTLTGS
jgi:hypothetical protein